MKPGPHSIRGYIATADKVLLWATLSFLLLLFGLACDQPRASVVSTIAVLVTLAGIVISWFLFSIVRILMFLLVTWETEVAAPADFGQYPENCVISPGRTHSGASLQNDTTYGIRPDLE